MAIRLSNVKRNLVLELDGENITVEVYKLTPAISERLAEKQRKIFEIQKEIAAIEKQESLDDMSRIETYNKYVAMIHTVYLDMFKICVVDYSIIEKTIDEIPYTSIEIFNSILTEINNEMIKTSNTGSEKKN
jgi:hypothetical protein